MHLGETPPSGNIMNMTAMGLFGMRILNAFKEM